MDNPGSSPFGRHQFLIYRLFSLAGLIPIGAYVVVHLLTNASIWNGAGTYQGAVNQIHSLGVILPVVEWVFIFIPLLFHATIGLIIISSGMPNAAAYPYNGNVRYTLQRGTGMIVFIFIIWHVLQMHHMGTLVGGGHFEPEAATSSVANTLAPLWIRVLYGIGVTCAVYHLANGLWTQGITWGIWTTPAAMRRAGIVCGGFGILLGIVGLSSVVGFSTVDVAKAKAIEERMNATRRFEEGETASPLPEPTPTKGAGPRHTNN